MFENFKKINLTTGLPYISITNNGITFSKSSVIKMGKPSYVVFLISEEEKKIAVQICDKEEESAVQFFRNTKNMNVRINNKDFLNSLSRLMNWNLEEEGYRILGEWYDSEKAMLIDLTKATAIGEKDNESVD